MNATVVLLAAGRSRRMGQPKLLLPWQNRTVIGQSLATAMCAPVSSVVVVTGYEADAVEAACHQTLADCRRPSPALSLVRNPNWSTGMAGSLLLGLANVAGPVEACFVALGDMPLVSPTVYALLLHALAAEPDRIFVPAWQGKRGHPVLLPGTMVNEAIALMQTIIREGTAPDVGLRGLLLQNPSRIRAVDVACPGVVIDLDTPKEYALHSPK